MNVFENNNAIFESLADMEDMKKIILRATGLKGDESVIVQENGEDVEKNVLTFIYEKISQILYYSFGASIDVAEMIKEPEVIGETEKGYAGTRAIGKVTAGKVGDDIPVADFPGAVKDLVAYAMTRYERGIYRILFTELNFITFLANTNAVFHAVILKTRGEEGLKSLPKPNARKIKEFINNIREYVLRHDVASEDASGATVVMRYVGTTLYDQLIDKVTPISITLDRNLSVVEDAESFKAGTVCTAEDIDDICEADGETERPMVNAPEDEPEDVPEGPEWQVHQTAEEVDKRHRNLEYYHTYTPETGGWTVIRMLSQEDTEHGVVPVPGPNGKPFDFYTYLNEDDRTTKGDWDTSLYYNCADWCITSRGMYSTYVGSTDVCYYVIRDNPNEYSAAMTEYPDNDTRRKFNNTAFGLVFAGQGSNLTCYKPGYLRSSGTSQNRLNHPIAEEDRGSINSILPEPPQSIKDLRKDNNEVVWKTAYFLWLVGGWDPNRDIVELTDIYFPPRNKDMKNAVNVAKPKYPVCSDIYDVADLISDKLVENGDQPKLLAEKQFKFVFNGKMFYVLDANEDNDIITCVSADLEDKISVKSSMYGRECEIVDVSFGERSKKEGEPAPERQAADDGQNWRRVPDFEEMGYAIQEVTRQHPGEEIWENGVTDVNRPILVINVNGTNYSFEYQDEWDNGFIFRYGSDAGDRVDIYIDFDGYFERYSEVEH